MVLLPTSLKNWGKCETNNTSSHHHIYPLTCIYAHKLCLPPMTIGETCVGSSSTWVPEPSPSCPLKDISQKLSLLLLGASFLIFSLSAYKIPQISQRFPATLEPVLSWTARVILLKPESHHVIPLLKIIWWLPVSEEREKSLKWPTRPNIIPSAPTSFLLLIYSASVILGSLPFLEQAKSVPNLAPLHLLSSAWNAVPWTSCSLTSYRTCSSITFSVSSTLSTLFKTACSIHTPIPFPVSVSAPKAPGFTTFQYISVC